MKKITWQYFFICVIINISNIELINAQCEWIYQDRDPNSYILDADIHTNPFELGLDRLVNLDSEINFIGKKALKKIKENGKEPKSRTSRSKK